MTGPTTASTDLVTSFLAERCELFAGARVPRAELRAAWCAWCERRQQPVAPAGVFGRRLRRVVPGIGRSRGRVNGATVGFYTGVRLKPVAADPADAVRLTRDRMQEAAARLLEQAGAGRERVGGAIGAFLAATAEYCAAQAIELVQPAVAQAAQLSQACERALCAAARANERTDRALRETQDALREAVRVARDDSAYAVRRVKAAEAGRRAAESIAAHVLGSGFTRRAGVVALPGVTDGLGPDAPDA